jgi:penicillin-binding protein 1C
LDDEYLGQTAGTHQMPVNPRAGTHRITLIDDAGNVFTKKLVVAKK